MKRVFSINAMLELYILLQAVGSWISLASPPQENSLGRIVYVAGSTTKVCQLTGQTDKEFNQLTASQTEKRFGLIGTDRGYSFEHNGMLFFLFGDSPPTGVFNGHPNAQSDPPRVTDDNDAIAYCPATDLVSNLTLNFVTDEIGAFKNPVVLDSHGNPAITLRTNETPIAGISDAGKIYVLFGTDNYLSNPPGGTSSPSGGATRSIVAVSTDSAKTFHFLYNFSRAPGAKFIMTAIARAQDGYLYFWGTQGDSLFRHSPAFLARKPIGSMGDSTAIEYLHAVNSDGTPVFMAGENTASALFHDSLPGPGRSMHAADAMGEVSVEWNNYVHRWVMLYNCSNNSTSNLRGIYMRTAPQPWGPWSAPETIFNPDRDNGFCYFIHRAVVQGETPCDSLSGPSRMADGGGDYAPYVISRFTTGDSIQMKSTFYFVMSTWNPYNVVIMKSSIEEVPATSVPVAEEMSPATFSLEQNFPNPFNPSTVISYTLPQKLHVLLTIFNELGQVVTVVQNEDMEAGSHEVSVDGTKLSTGVYFYRLEAGPYVQTRKLLMLR